MTINTKIQVRHEIIERVISYLVICAIMSWFFGINSRVLFSAIFAALVTGLTANIFDNFHNFKQLAKDLYSIVNICLAVVAMILSFIFLEVELTLIDSLAIILISGLTYYLVFYITDNFRQMPSEAETLNTKENNQ